VCSKPSTTVSRYFSLPSATQAPARWWNSDARSPWSVTMKPRTVSRFPTIIIMLRGPGTGFSSL
jgi:hypothetical protein